MTAVDAVPVAAVTRGHLVVFGGPDGLGEVFAAAGWTVADATAEVADFLAAQGGPARAVLVGFGPAGAAVVDFADRHPERAVAVVAVGGDVDREVVGNLLCPTLVTTDLAEVGPFLTDLEGGDHAGCPVSRSALPALTPTLLNDPEVIGRLRELGRVHRINAPGVATSWILTGHEVSTVTLADPRLAGEVELTAGFRLQPPDVPHRGERDLVTIEAAEHARLRRLVGRHLTPARVDALRPRMQRETDALLDALPTDEPVDLLRTFARPLPVIVLCELFGVPVADRGYLQEWLVERMTTVPPSAHSDVDDYLRGLVELRRGSPSDDLLGWVVAAEGERLSVPDLIGASRLLMVGGHRAPTTLLVNGIAALLRHREQWLRLVADPGLVPAAVEELLRFVTPFPVGLARHTTTAVEVDGVTLPEGNLVAASLVAANRDPALFTDPDELDIGREPNPHLAFGHGHHFCLGAALARAQAQVALTALVRRFPDLELVDPAGLQYRQSRVRYLLELPVVLRPATEQ